MISRISTLVATASLSLLVITPVSAQQDPEFMEPDYDLELDEALSADVGSPNESIAPPSRDLPEFVVTIITTDGDLHPDYERVRHCQGATQCVDGVVERARGDFVALDGRWVRGFVRTRRGEEVLRVDPAHQESPQR